MAGPKDSPVRTPAVAGIFYPGDPIQCRALAQSYLDAAGLAPEAPAGRRWIGGIVPHAGWICSGAIAGQTIGALQAQSREPSGSAEGRIEDRVAERLDVVVIFGAVHTPLPIHNAAFDSHARWAVPGGESAVAQDVEGRLLEQGDFFRVDDRFHVQEHAVEVELPLIQAAWPNATVLPIEVPAIDSADEIGRRVARQLIAAGLNAVYLASSDLTHYGANYGFAPAGVGINALSWAKENDRRLLQIVTDMAVEAVMPEVKGHFNACGAGAIAAMMAACREMGASVGRVLSHANSYETLAGVAKQSPNNAVGYAAVVVG